MPEDLRMAIEETAMRLIDERRRQSKITIDTLASTLYPDKPIANARMMIQRLRLPQGDNGPRKMNLGEFVELSHAVGIDPVRALSTVLQEIQATRI
jgi:hypothetical protein